MIFDDSRARQIRTRLLDPETPLEDAAADLARIADMARQEPTLAAVIAERLRPERLRRREDLMRRIKTSLLPGQSHRLFDAAVPTISRDHAANCVAHTGHASLVATTMLELAEERGPSPEWAKALVAVAGDEGTAHLARMRAFPGWSEVIPSLDPPPFGIEALVSPIADVRGSALASLAHTPRPVHLRALLLGAELHRHVLRVVLRERVTPIDVAEWSPLLVVHAGRMGVEDIPRGALVFPYLAEHFLYKLIDAGAARAPMETPQHLTPGLRELEVDGVVSFAARHMFDPRLTKDALAQLDEAEVQLVASAAHLWGPSPQT